ncbi:hypothetical protein E4U09_007953, partial [Claviceps aff. purpurea]
VTRVSEITMTEDPTITITDDTHETKTIPVTPPINETPIIPQTPTATYRELSIPRAEQRHGLLTPKPSPGIMSGSQSPQLSPQQSTSATHRLTPDSMSGDRSPHPHQAETPQSSPNSSPRRSSPNIPEIFTQDTGDDNVLANDESENVTLGDEHVQASVESEIILDDVNVPAETSETTLGDDNGLASDQSESVITNDVNVPVQPDGMMTPTPEEDIEMSEGHDDTPTFEDTDAHMTDGVDIPSQSTEQPPQSHPTPRTKRGVATPSKIAGSRRPSRSLSNASRGSSSHPREPTRRSSRIQKLKKDGRVQDWSILRKRRPDLFLNNFIWDPKVLLEDAHPEATSEDLQELKTVFAVIDACCDKTTRANLKEKIKSQKLHQRDLVKAPRSYREEMKHPLKDHWLDAMVEEITKLKQRETWREIDRNEAKTTPLPLKWVFTYKFTEDNTLDR